MEEESSEGAFVSSESTIFLWVFIIFFDFYCIYSVFIVNFSLFDLSLKRQEIHGLWVLKGGNSEESEPKHHKKGARTGKIPLFPSLTFYKGLSQM